MNWVRKSPGWLQHDREIFDYEKPAGTNVVLRVWEGQKEPSEYCALSTDDEWNAWFEKDLLRPEAQSEPGLWILLARRPVDPYEKEGHDSALLMTLPWSEDTFKTITDRFFVHGSMAKTINRGHAEFKRTYLHMKPTTTTTAAAGEQQQQQQQQEEAIVYNVRTSNLWPSDVALSMTYFPSRGLTYAVFFGCTQATMDALKGHLRNAEGAECHPLLLAGIVAEMERDRQRGLVKEDLRNLHRVSNKLSRIQPEDWDEEAAVTAEEKSSSSSSSSLSSQDEVGPQSAAAAMNRWMEVHLLKNGLKTWQSQMREMTAHIDELDAGLFLPSEDDSPLPNVGDLVGGVAVTREMLDKKRTDELHKAKQRAVGLRMKERLEEMMADYEEYVRNCILNMDGMTLATSLAHTKANMAIALSAKRDSSQMKSIALLTMVFLPGTFLATFFSMTFFQWNPDPGKPIVSTNIWIYVVITVIFTLVTLGLWGWFLNRKKKKKNNMMKNNTKLKRKRLLLLQLTTKFSLTPTGGDWMARLRDMISKRTKNA